MSYDSPPSYWAGATSAGSDVYWAPGPIAYGVKQEVLVWHWCPASGAAGRWEAQTTGDHTLVQLEPLHLEPSLLWHCCGKHGYIRDGVWTDA